MLTTHLTQASPSPAKDGTELRSEIRPKTEMKISETEVQPGELLLQYRGEKNPSKIRQDWKFFWMGNENELLILPLEGSPDEVGEGCLNEHPPSRFQRATSLKGGIILVQRFISHDKNLWYCKNNNEILKTRQKSVKI